MALAAGHPVDTTRPPRSLRNPRDLGVAVGAVVLDLALFSQLSDAGDQTAWVSRDVPPVVIVVAGLVAIVPLAYRRRAPFAVCLILAGHAAAVTLLLGSRPFVSLLVALYGAAVWLPRRRALGAVAAVLAAHALAVAYEGSFAGVDGFAVAAVASIYLLADVATWGAGRWGASARARRTARRMEEQQTTLAAAAVDAERLRISHELHDIVAHAVTVMLLQAGGARAVLRSVGDQSATAPAVEALDAVDVTGRQAVAELRRLLTVLRAEGAESERAGVGPAIGLAELDVLVERVRDTGVAVVVRTVGVRRPLDPSVDLSAYRVIQEALTNINKYAGPGGCAELILDWRPDRLMITIDDDGPHGPLGSLGSGGFGLVGLTERVTLMGGRLEHGPRLDGAGYRVRAQFPLTDSIEATPVIEELFECSRS